MSREAKARELKSNGTNCSIAIYTVFKDDYKISDPPAPRSIDGKCGALLTTIEILKELGKEEYIEEYSKDFIKEFGSDKCLELMKKDRRCNDYVGWSTSKIEEFLERE